MFRRAPDLDTRRVASPEHTTAADFALPALDLRLLARRAALPAALAATALAVVLLAGGPIGTLTDALSRALSADPRWIALAAVAELLSFGGYIALFWLVGRRATPRLDLRAGAEITLGGAAATRLLPTAGAGGAALTLWAINKTGIGRKHAGRMLLTFLSLLYGVFLAGIVVSGAAIALGYGGELGPHRVRRRRRACRRAGDRPGARAGRARRRSARECRPDRARRSAARRLGA